MKKKWKKEREKGREVYSLEQKINEKERKQKYESENNYDENKKELLKLNKEKNIEKKIMLKKWGK